MTTAQVVETSFTVNKNSPIQDYVHPDDQTQPFHIFRVLSDNPIKTIGNQAFSIPGGKVLIFMIRTRLKAVSLRVFSFPDFHNLTSVITMNDGQIGTMKVFDSFQQERSTIYLGLGQDSSTYLNLGSYSSLSVYPIRDSFKRAGFANATLGNDKLLPCSLGAFVNVSRLECVECPAGILLTSTIARSSISVTSNGKPDVVPRGFYSDTIAFVSDGCLRCPNGTFVPYSKAPGKSARECIACPQGTDTSSFAGFRACSCLKGFHRTHLFKGCSQCDEEGLQCVDDHVKLKKGYWWKWENQTHKQIYESFARNLLDSRNSSSTYSSLIEFPYTVPTPHKCPQPEACYGGFNSSCADGYQGPLCEICSDGYYKQFQTCKKCPTKKWMIGQLSIVVAVILVIIFFILWSKKRKQQEEQKGRSTVDIILGRLKIVIGFYQVTDGLLQTFSYIKWPDSLSVIGKYSEMIQLNVFQIAPLHCIFPELKVNAFKNLFAILAINVTAIIVAIIIYCLRKLLLERSASSKEEKLRKSSQTKELILRNLFFFLYVTYLSTCSNTASVLPPTCRMLCSDEKKTHCQKFLKTDYSIDCESTNYGRSVIVAYIAVVYILLLPTASLIALWKARLTVSSQNEMEDEHQNPDIKVKSSEVTTGLRFLFENYHPRSWYWELVDTVRKVVLTSGIILVGGESRAYVGLACVMSGLYGMFFAYVSPIADPFENRLMLISLAVTFLNLGIGAVSKINSENIPASIDPYVDNIMFKVLVFGANSLVIGLLVVQYIVYIYRFIREWLKNPRWSFSCCLALLLPLNDLQGEVRGFAGTNVFKNQLPTGKMNMPSISSSFQDTGAINFSLEEDQPNLAGGGNSDHEETPGNKSDKQTQTRESGKEFIFTKISVHEVPKMTYDTTSF